MKGRITTVLSLTGVLVAGSAAAMVNSQVLQSAGASSNSTGGVAVGSGTDTNPTTPMVIVAGDSSKINSNVLTATQAMYQVGDAGLVVLDTAGDVLTVVSVTPNSGWTVVKAESSSFADIEVKLQSGNTVVEFKANLQLGVITTSVESKIVGSGTGGTNDNGTTPGSGTVGNQTPGSGTVGHDDDHADDDHADDHADDSGHGGDDD
ncbi:hypothetical protein BH10ACT2_BH10ACT2_22360 [soil metagenome]